MLYGEGQGQISCSLEMQLSRDEFPFLLDLLEDIVSNKE